MMKAAAFIVSPKSLPSYFVLKLLSWRQSDILHSLLLVLHFLFTAVHTDAVIVMLSHVLVSQRTRWQLSQIPLPHTCTSSPTRYDTTTGQVVDHTPAPSVSLWLCVHHNVSHPQSERIYFCSILLYGPKRIVWMWAYSLVPYIILCLGTFIS